MEKDAGFEKDFFEQQLKNFEILKLRVYKNRNTWEIDVKPLKIVTVKEIKNIEENIAKEFKLSQFKMNVEEHHIKKHDVFSVIENWENLNEIVLQKYPSFTGFLKDAKVDYTDNMIEICVAGKDMADCLNARKCDTIFEKYIKEYYNLKTRIRIKSNIEELTKEDYVSRMCIEEDELVRQTMKNNKDKENSGDKGSTVGSVLLGKAFTDKPIKIAEIAEDSGRTTIEGSIFGTEVKTLNNGKTIITFNITDYTSSIIIKLFIRDETQTAKLTEGIKDGKNFKIKGDVQLDPYMHETVIYPINIVETQKNSRMDTAENKRIELHAHTSMSTLDGFCPVKLLVKRAIEWGHKAIAITDHGVVQAFPDAYEAAKKSGLKVIYGVEGYFVNDGVPVIYNSGSLPEEEKYIVFDIETTGLSAANDRITEIGAVKIENGVITDRFSQLINPGINIPEFITKLTGISDEMVGDKPTIDIVLPQFLQFVGDLPLIAHNALFDWGFIKKAAERMTKIIHNPVIDTLQMARILLPDLKKHKLDVLCNHFNIKNANHHRAENDAEVTAYLFFELVKIMKEKGIEKIEDVTAASMTAKSLKNAENHHIIILVKNAAGLRNLYKLISISHLDYFYKKPRIPKSLLLQHREGLIFGSACEAGELYRSILEDADEKRIMEIAKFYDYLEIQPNGNNDFLIRTGKVKNEQQLNDINKRIVELGEKLGKPVIATGDVHFLDPEDEVFRRIIMAGQGFSDADDQAPLYLKTTDEMLQEFSYLGKERAYDVVIKNAEKLIEQIDNIKPIPDETSPPIIEGDKEQIKEMTYLKVKSIYGDELPKVVQERIDKELTSIIKYGFAVMYLIAQKLVTKSLRDGYLVGSRGSVGSSFVATMCDITEVNPLPPHYICSNCKSSEFITDGSYSSGADMPDKICPVCGTLYTKEGHDIPFEVFLGFDGDKEPDIDLNFAGEYQSEAHRYTEELFGKGYVYRAGTIATIADKTAYGFVKKYFEAKNVKVSTAEINRLVKGCTGIKRTTGQHPGGVMIVPSYKDIFEFTPIQRPADNTDSNVITTHFDYHSISGRLLKLDILGHDVPSIIRMLEDMTNTKVTNIKLDEAKTMSLFTSTQALGVNLDDIDCKVGSLGIPEFGTKFVRQMLMDTKPTTFEELVRISGLSHGTNVWINNAQEYIRNNTAVLKEVISTRDDIMIYLIHKGVNNKNAFKIMENVRKGKGLTKEHEQEMAQHNVPQWYIDSCNKIEYMFPKAHAVAYVMMSFRIAYYKVYYPEAFYATFFTIKVEDFDNELFIKGKDAVKAKWKEIEKLGNNATTKEKGQAILLEIVYEMYLRGIKLLPVDLYKSQANSFLVTKDGILPPLNALQGVGVNAAISIVKEREGVNFLSIDEFREKTKVSKPVIEILKQHGCLSGLPDNNQLSLF